MRSDLLTGTVTLLFTDIEGSTRLLHEFGERYADVLAEHRRVLRKAFQSHGGVEVDTQGDAFFLGSSRWPCRTWPFRPRTAHKPGTSRLLLPPRKRETPAW
jgi:class 3 adenylate cyclase